MRREASLRITAVVTSYNRPDFVAATLKAIARQSLLPVEAIVSDDGSTADVLGAVKALAPALPFPVAFVTQEDRGFRAAKVRNNAIRLATGDYLVFFDQDIVGPRDYLKTFAENARKGEFLVGMPVRLTEEKSLALAANPNLLDDPNALAGPEDIRRIGKQKRKDDFYRLLHAFGLRRIGPKLRSGVFGAWRADLIAVNGFDEEYRGWGNEDDDLGYRLHKAGTSGRNVFGRVFPFHLFHPSHNAAGGRSNRELYERNLREIAGGRTRAVAGLGNPGDADAPSVTRFAGRDS